MPGTDYGALIRESRVLVPDTFSFSTHFELTFLSKSAHI